MLDKRIPKINDSVVVWHEGELKPGNVILVREFKSGEMSFVFDVKTKRKHNNSYDYPKYVDCYLTGNSWSLHPCVNANIEWSPIKLGGSPAWFFYTKEEYVTWLRNEYEYNMNVGKTKFENYKRLYESEINIELSEFKI